MAGTDQPLPESMSPLRPLYPFASWPQPGLWCSATTLELQLIDSMSLRQWGLLASRDGYLLDGPAPFSTSALGPPAGGESGEAPGAAVAAGPFLEWSQLMKLAVTALSSHLGWPHLDADIWERGGTWGFLLPQHPFLPLWAAGPGKTHSSSPGGSRTPPICSAGS